MTSLVGDAQSASDEFPSLEDKYTRRQAHLEVRHLFVSELSAQFFIIESDLSEPSAYLPVYLPHARGKCPTK